MGALAAARRKHCGFKEGGLAYGEMTARDFTNSAVLPSRVLLSTRLLDRLC